MQPFVDCPSPLGYQIRKLPQNGEIVQSETDKESLWVGMSTLWAHISPCRRTLSFGELEIYMLYDGIQRTNRRATNG